MGSRFLEPVIPVPVITSSHCISHLKWAKQSFLCVINMHILACKMTYLLYVLPNINISISLYYNISINCKFCLFHGQACKNRKYSPI